MSVFHATFFLAGVALVTSLAILLWPGRTAAFLLLFAPLIWGFGAADFRSPRPAPPNVVMAISSAGAKGRYCVLHRGIPLRFS